MVGQRARQPSQYFASPDSSTTDPGLKSRFMQTMLMSPDIDKTNLAKREQHMTTRASENEPTIHLVPNRSWDERTKIRAQTAHDTERDYHWRALNVIRRHSMCTTHLRIGFESGASGHVSTAPASEPEGRRNPVRPENTPCFQKAVWHHGMGRGAMG